VVAETGLEVGRRVLQAIGSLVGAEDLIFRVFVVAIGMDDGLIGALGRM